MKATRFVIGLALLLAFAACHTSVETRLIASQDPMASPLLIAVDSLMWRQPDSALTLLLPWFDTVHTNETFNNHYGNLLLAELLYKNDYAQANRRELKAAVAYFDSIVQVPELVEGPSKKPKVFLCARAHYINGVGYYEQDSVVEASEEYIKALEIMEECFEEKELVGEKGRFMALTYTRLTELYSDSYLHEQAIYFGKCSMPFYQKQQLLTSHIVWILKEIGMNYEMLEQYDSAGCYYQIAFETVDDTNSLLYRDVVTNIACLNYKTKVEHNASLNQLHRLLLQSEGESEYYARNLAIGAIYYHEYQFDSAYSYLSEVFGHTKDFGSKKQSAEWLIEICEAQGRDMEISKYANFLAPFANVDENLSYIKSKLTMLHQNYVQGRQEMLHQKQIKRNNHIVNQAIGLLFGIIAVVVILYVVNKKRHSSLKHRHKEIGMVLESERHSHKMQQAALAGRLRESNNSLRMQSEKMAELQNALSKEEVSVSYCGDYELFMQEDICKEIIKSLEGTFIKRISVPEDYPELILSAQQLLRLALATEKHFQGFEVYLRRSYPRISAMDLDICRLFLLGLNEKQASILLRRDYSTIMEHVRKMKKGFKTESNLRDFIKNGK